MSTECILFKELNPQLKKWKIICKVLKKEKPYDFSKNNRFGRVVNMCLIDEQGTKMQATIFLETIPMFDQILVEDKFYFISNGQIREADPKYNRGSIPYSIIFTKDTTITETGQFQTITNNFERNDLSAKARRNQTISELLSKRIEDEVIDLTAIVIGTDQPTAVTRRSDGKQIQRQNLTLTDNSCSSTIMLTLWESLVEKEGRSILSIIEEKPMIMVTSLRTHIFRGNFGLKTTHQTQIQINPENDQTSIIKQWSTQNEQEIQRRSVDEKAEDTSTLKPEKVSIKELKEYTNNGHVENNLYEVQISVVDVNRNQDPWYMACNRCSKTITKDNEKFSCTKCSQKDVTPITRYNLRVNIDDGTSNIWVTCFNEEAEKILNISAEHLKEKKDTNFSDYISIIENCINKSYILTIKVTKKIGKFEGFNYTCQNVDKAEIKVEQREDLDEDDEDKEKEENRTTKRRRLILRDD